MPYIKEVKRRQALDSGDLPRDAGEANYVITTQWIIPVWLASPCYDTVQKLATEYLYTTRNSLWQTISQEVFNTARALAYLEFYRRVGALYEDQKIKENGDVYPNRCFAFAQPKKKEK